MSKKEVIGMTMIVIVIIIGIAVTIRLAGTLPEIKMQEQVIVKPCEQHEYVTTSRYNWFLESYKTISKCTKCGKEV